MNAEDVYILFQKSKARYFNKPYYPHKQFPPKEPDKWSIKKTGAKRLIRKFDTFEDADVFMKENRGKGYHKQFHKGKTLSDEYLESLDILSRRFSTVWANIEPSIYFDCGFEIFGERFCYLSFFDQRITRLYIIKDKNKKLNINFSKKELVDSAKFVLKYIQDNQIRSFGVYCLSRDRYALPVQHYIKNEISPHFLVWLLKERYFRLDDNDRAVVPYILQNYKEIYQKLDEVKDFCKKLKEKFGI
jgi:hypothetical protein